MEQSSLIKQQRKRNQPNTFHYKTLKEVPTCHDIFSRHQIIRCIVTHVNKSAEGYYVSLRPSLFNSQLRMNDLVIGYCLLCSIKSIEDKGYVIDTGIYVQDKGGENEIAVRAFMSYNDIPPGMIQRILRKRREERTAHKDGAKTGTETEEDEEDIIPIGFPLELVVMKSNTITNAIGLTLDFKKYYRELTKLPIVPIIALKPGFLVKCKIKQQLHDGIAVEFGKVYQGVIDFSHIDKILDPKWKTHYKVGQEIMARIILVHPKQQYIHLSAKPHLNKQPEDEWLPQALHYEIYSPRRCGDVIPADVRRIAYNSLYLYSKLLDPEYLKDATEQ